MNKKYNLNKIKVFDQKIADNYLQYFTYTSTKNNDEYFKILLSAEKITDNIFKNNKGYFYIQLKNFLNEIDFHSANNFYQQTNKDLPFIFIGKNTTDYFTDLITNSPISYIVLNYYELYNLMKSKNYYPTNINIKKNKFLKLNKLKTKALNSLTKNHFFKFLFSGLSLILISIFIPYSFYYMLFGSLLLIFSIICLFNKNGSNCSNNKVDLNSFIKKD